MKIYGARFLILHNIKGKYLGSILEIESYFISLMKRFL